MLETEAALAIQRTWSNLKLRRGAKAYAEHLRRDRAALKIQLCFGRFKRYMKEVRRNQARREQAAAGFMQRVWRGKQQRGLVAQGIAYTHWLNSQAPLWVRVQTAWRGYYVRLHDQDVARLLLDLYENRRQEALNAMCVFIQATVRRFLARIRAGAWFEVKYQRNRDRNVAVLRIQCCGRAYNALRRKLMMQIEKERIAALRNKAACRIQAFFRGMHGQYSALMKKQELERLQRLRNRKALDCQRAYRGFRGREIAEGLRFTRMREGKACTLIQRNWRMSRILPWRGIRMNKIAAFVFRREELELDERAAAVEERDRKRVEGAQHDSASDEELEDVEDVWEEGWDDDEGMPFWYPTHSPLAPRPLAPLAPSLPRPLAPPLPPYFLPLGCFPSPSVAKPCPFLFPPGRAIPPRHTPTTPHAALRTLISACARSVGIRLRSTRRFSRSRHRSSSFTSSLLGLTARYSGLWRTLGSPPISPHSIRQSGGIVSTTQTVIMSG